MVEARASLLDVPTDDGQLAASLPVSDLVALVRERARRDPVRALLLSLDDGERVGRVLTAVELDRRARAIAAELQARGLRGERVLLLYPPGLDFVEAFYGCVYAGALAVPAYPPNPARLGRTLPRLVAIVRDATPAMILTTSDALPLVQGMASLEPAFAGIQTAATNALPESRGETWQPPSVTPDDVAFLQYTSGSTAAPKGVMVTHANLLHTAEDLARSVAYRHWERLLIWLPTFHDMGLVCGLIIPLYKGLPMHLMSPLAFLQHPMRWWQAVSELQITQTVGPNFAYDLSVRKSTPEQRATLKLSQVRVAGTVAEPIRPATVQSFCEAFAPAGFRPEAFYAGYGLAEATLKVSGGPVRWISVDGPSLVAGRVAPTAAETLGARYAVSCGDVQLGMDVRIVNPETHRACTPDEVGEIWVRGPGVAKGYWNRPELTRSVFGARIAGLDEGPFLRTGDLGFVRESELFVTGRLKDLIIIDGVNMYPQDIEWTVETAHQAIRPGCAAAFAIENGGRESVVVAAEISSRGGEAPAAPAIVRAVRRAVAEAHQVALHDFVLVKPGSIPKTSNGKIQRHAARDAYLQDALERWTP